MGITYRKTAKGVEEIRTRANKLAPRARSALILVDGLRSEEDLARVIQTQAAETLQLLLDLQLIEASAEATPVAQAAPAAATAVATPVGGPSPATATAPARPPVNFAAVQREAVRRLNEAVGPLGESLAIKIERARDLETLRPLLVAARRLIVEVRGEAAAQAYIAALSAL